MFPHQAAINGVHVGDERIRRCREDCAGLEDVVFRIAPPVPQSCKGERRAGRQADGVRLSL